MHRKLRILLVVAVMLPVTFSTAKCQAANPPAAAPNTALVNGKWFNGSSFEPRTLYSVGGKFTSEKPERIDRTLDLAGLWIVPPFAEAHNHNIGTGMVESDRRAIHHFLADGVFYVKIQGNIRINEEVKKRLGLNRPDSVDAVLAQGSQITGSGGHPAELFDIVLLPFVYLPGFTAESLKDYRYFTVDSADELDRKWTAVLEQKPDFIKVILWYSEEYEKRKNDPGYFGTRGLDPRLLPAIVKKAHAAHLRVSVHVNTAADFHNALAAGADEIAHIPLTGVTPIAAEDAELAAKRGVVVDTTCGVVPTLPPFALPPSDRPQVLKNQLINLRLLRDHGVTLAIGSDLPSDSSVNEVDYLRGLGIFDDLTLLRMWTETTPKSIFPERKIGALDDGYEASFLALEGNPLEDWQNVEKIRVRFKQGFVIEP